jgi:hypothetical protein
MCAEALEERLAEGLTKAKRPWNEKMGAKTGTSEVPGKAKGGKPPRPAPAAGQPSSSLIPDPAADLPPVIAPAGRSAPTTPSSDLGLLSARTHGVVLDVGSLCFFARCARKLLIHKGNWISAWGSNLPVFPHICAGISRVWLPGG